MNDMNNMKNVMYNLFGITTQKYDELTSKLYGIIGQHHYATIFSTTPLEFDRLCKRCRCGDKFKKQSYEETIIKLKKNLIITYGKTLDGKINTHLIQQVNEL